MSMSDSDSTSTSSGSVTAIEPPSRQFPPDRDPAPPRHAVYPRRQSSLSDANLRDLDSFTSGPLFPASRHGSSHRGPSSTNTNLDTLVAIDRKRRLTSSAQDHGRRRQGPGASGDRTFEEILDPVEELQPSRSASANSRQRQHEVVDLTGSSPPTQLAPHRHRQQSRTSSSSSRRYVVPAWQPDSEVPDCPICGRTFTWLFRRHHCRKCGRVVCNDCSPHRITIPRQFIVNPPSPDDGSATRNDGTRVETIDLTGDDNGDGQPLRRYLGGGEKVRLCNPCVPDPQPDPLPNFPPSSSSLGSSAEAASGPTPLLERPRPDTFSRPFRPPNRHRTGTLPTMPPPGSLTSAHSHSFGSFGPRPRPSSLASPSALLPQGYDPRFGSHNNPLPPLPPTGTYGASMYGHGRYSSLDSRSHMTADSNRRHRGSFMFDPLLRDPGAPLPVPRSSRPRLNEEDICPICRRALPPKGSNGDETEREAHIMNCITARDPASHTGGEGSSSRPSTMHMVSFVASEKDCVGDDGSTQECSICMIEYDPGEELSRLECFCKFHKECIVSWLNRKAECPVHKASGMHF